MSIWQALFGGGGTKSPVETIGEIIDDVWTSDEEEMTAERLKMAIAMKPSLAQAKINETQAAHRSVFVAGARPFLMWVCGVGLGMAFVVNPVLNFYNGATPTIEVPVDAMLELTLAMLGLAGYRTIEKINGVTK